MRGTVSWIDVPDGSPFPLTNLPLGVGHTGDRRSRAWVAVGAAALDLAATASAGRLDGTGLPDGCFGEPSLNRYLAAGPDVWAAVRARLREVLDDEAAGDELCTHLVDRHELVMGVPVAPVDYVDFYSSLHHATNLGRLFRPDGEALMPNWRRIPIGYHGRTGTLVPHGSLIRRPRGYRSVDGEPEVGPSQRLDIELEVGTVIGVGSETGTPIDIADAVGDTSTDSAW